MVGWMDGWMDGWLVLASGVCVWEGGREGGDEVDRSQDFVGSLAAAAAAAAVAAAAAALHGKNTKENSLKL